MLFLIKNLFGIEKISIFALINKMHRYGWERKKYLGKSPLARMAVPI